MRLNHYIALLFAIIVIALFSIYLAINLSQGDGEVVMPLDDVYIHFQYARQLAQGQPYVYSPSDGATSGATSFIYPYILAFGYLIGFQGLNLGIWSMIVGCMALWGAMYAIYRLCIVFSAPTWLAVLTPISFALTGSVNWHAVSGMETLLIVCFSLWTLLAFVEKRPKLFVLVAVFLALTRPEGSIMAGIATVLYGLRAWFDNLNRPKYPQFLLFTLPILAIAVQPTVNYIITGSFSASGSQAKSLLGIIPKDWTLIITRIIENFVSLWLELFTGYSPSQEVWYLIILTVPLGILGLAFLLRQREHRMTVLLIILWLGAVSVAISTLDTAFWHFKRYQLPLMALCVPFSVVPIVWQLKRFPQSRWLIYAFDGIILPVFLVLMFSSFITRYETNIQYVRQQPLAMARWLSENTPESATVAVHDVGMMRYMGNRKTIDIVGLTTPNAALYWRNGVGSVAEFLLKQKPDYIASYGRGHGYGLYMLADTQLYGEPLAEFKVDLDLKLNVALAADTQAIYKPDWDEIITDTNLENVFYEVNVGDIESEFSRYSWQNEESPNGFATLAYEFDLLGCAPSHSQSCKLIEGARQITGEERLIVDLSGIERSEDIILKTRVHPAYAISFDVYVNGKLIDTQWIPQNAGHWLDIQTRIPSRGLASSAKIQIIPHLEAGEVYIPARHTLIDEVVEIPEKPESYIASYQDSHVLLTDYTLNIFDTQLELIFDWYADGKTEDDYRFFVHIYDDINQPPVAQWDDYLGNSTLPLGNWLEGVRQDTINLNIDTLPAGDYQMMIGFYNALTNDRLMPISDNNLIVDGRLILQNLEIE